MSIYIKEFPNQFPSEYCSELIKFFEDHNGDKNKTTFWRDENSSVDLEKIHLRLNEFLFPCIEKYFSDFSDLADAEDLYLDNFIISKQGEGFFDDLHYDTPIYQRESRTGYRPFICMIYLNHEEFTGGQVIFPQQKYVLEPEEGKIVFFPTSFLFPHMVSSITGGNRYSIRVTFNSTTEKLDYI